MVQFLNYIKASLFVKSCLLEVVKASVTFLFGYISFTIYQRYKNKSDNNKLYIQFLKLEKEMINNKNLIDSNLNKYKELEELNKKFYINNKLDDSLLDLYRCASNLRIYREEHNDYYDEGRIDVVYSETPADKISDIEGELNYLEEDYQSNYMKIEEYKAKISKLKLKNIFDDLIELESKSKCFLTKNFQLKQEVNFLYMKLVKFNKLNIQEKRIYLSQFCELILESKNDFVNSLRTYNDLVLLKLELDIYKEPYKLDINFSSWQRIDIDLLAVYDAELYLQLEELYVKLSDFKIYINRKETLEKAKKIVVEELEPVINANKNHLKKVLLKTNKLFKSI